MGVKLAILIVMFGIIGAEEGKVYLSPAKISPLIRRSQPLTREQIAQIKDIENEILKIKKSTKEKVIALSASHSEEDMKKVSALKLKTEIEILNLRKKIAEIKGDKKLVSEYERAINNLTNPKKYLKPPIKGNRLPITEKPAGQRDSSPTTRN